MKTTMKTRKTTMKTRSEEVFEVGEAPGRPRTDGVLDSVRRGNPPHERPQSQRRRRKTSVNQRDNARDIPRLRPGGPPARSALATSCSEIRFAQAAKSRDDCDTEPSSTPAMIVRAYTRHAGPALCTPLAR